MNRDYRNPALPAAERAEILLGLMTPEEKVGQMMQISFSRVSRAEAEDWALKGAGSFLHTLGDDARRLQELAMQTRLGIPMLFGIDAIHGHALNNAATVFPSQLAMSSSWNAELVEEVGRITAREVSADGLHWTFSPVLCIGRDLRWGRIDETFGEDPYLIGVLAAAIIRGYQGKNLSDPDSVLACAKHYLAYGESTGGRDSYDSCVSMRKIREVFLPPFIEAVKADCATFMAGYQSIDGVPASANSRILRDILKEELGFGGFVVTDWNNTGSLVAGQFVAADMYEAAATVVNAGNDMIMNTNEFYDAALDLLKQGRIPAVLIDDAVRRILCIKFKMGLFDGRALPDPADRKILSCPEHMEANLRIARESIVLLENRNNTLPLGGGIRRLAVIGPNADDIVNQLGDWTFYTHPDPNPDAVPGAPYHTVLDGITEMAVKRGIDVLYHRGCDIMDTDDQDIPGAVETASRADAVIAVVGDCLEQNGECRDRADLNLSGAQDALLRALKSCGKPLIVILVSGKPLSIPWIAENADALIAAFSPGAMGGKAVAEVLFGETNPSGRLSISFPYHSGQLPVYYNQLPGWHGYRKYMDMPHNALYDFGYGLSYTRFEYSGITLSKSECSADDTVMVGVTVSNTGCMDGCEVVQLYVRDNVSSVVTPVKSLKGFKKVFIKMGRSVEVRIPLRIADLALVTPDEDYVVEPGEFTVMAGPSSRDCDLLKATLTVRAE